jgi:hypothetical protein
MQQVLRRAFLQLTLILLVSSCNAAHSSENRASENRASENRASENRASESRASETTASPAASGKTCDPQSNHDCAAGEYCKTEMGVGFYKKGVCAPKTNMCNMLYQAVCGRDGKTYPNACHAARTGVNLAYTGACKPSKSQ